MLYKIWDKVKVIKIIWDQSFFTHVWKIRTIAGFSWFNGYLLEEDYTNSSWYEEEFQSIEEFKKWELVEVSNYLNPTKTQWIRRIYLGKFDWPYNWIIVVSKDYEDDFRKWEPYAIQTYSQIRKIAKECTIPKWLTPQEEEAYKILFN